MSTPLAAGPSQAGLPQAGLPHTDGRPRRARPSYRRVALVVVLALLVSTLAAVLLLGSRTSGAHLDPDNPASDGGQAIARVLQQEGVDVVAVRSRAALRDSRTGPGTSVVVTRGQLLTSQMWSTFLHQVSTADRVVLVAPGNRALTALQAPLTRRGGGSFTVASAGCDAPLARGLSVAGGSERYDGQDGADAQVCFSPGGGFGAGGDRGGYLAVLPATSTRPEIVLLGTEQAVRNGDVRDAGHAALGLRALGSSPRLVWWSVSPADLDVASAPPPVWPAWLAPVALVLGLTVLALMIVRGRRLGRLVTEPLPVVVRAGETTRSRGQLYRRAGDTARAAAVLRGGTRTRLARYLGVSAGAPAATLVDAVASSTGRPAAAVGDLLFGPPTHDETTLTALAAELSRLESETRSR